ncbi:uncharacterized protein LOC132926413 [Rhopalosiphum padi]|uniref:uncharacterized protein LOC132926413 n=1 Tax=Rhopalosiphum padi TaxID=40932 RepID=UPI00298D94A0|nr:uncharacterized protein LOC132926413 [Rhopalosiphum padi]
MDFSDSDCDSILDTYVYGNISSDPDEHEDNEVNNNCNIPIPDQGLFCIEDSGSDINDSDKDPEYTLELNNLNVLNNDNTFVNDDYGVGDNDNINDVNYSKSY